MPLQAVWLSIFHSIAAFNNAGFDALGGGQSLIPYRNDLLLNLVTDALVIVGGIGFMVILDVGRCHGQFRRMTFHTKVVLSTTAVLLVGGAVLLQLTDHMGWLAALFQSMTARDGRLFQRGFRQHEQRGSAGHHDLNVHRRIAGLDGRRHQDHNVFCADAAGAVHLLQAAARRVPPASAGRLAVQGATIMLMGLMVVGCGTFALCVLEPQLDFGRLLFEQISAYSTSGLSTGITAELCLPAGWF